MSAILLSFTDRRRRPNESALTSGKRRRLRPGPNVVGPKHRALALAAAHLSPVFVERLVALDAVDRDTISILVNEILIAAGLMDGNRSRAAVHAQAIDVIAKSATTNP